MKKYALPPTKIARLDLKAIKLFGRQILETLNLLHEKGLPHGKFFSCFCFTLIDCACMAVLSNERNLGILTSLLLVLSSSLLSSPLS